MLDSIIYSDRLKNERLLTVLFVTYKREWTLRFFQFFLIKFEAKSFETRTDLFTQDFKIFCVYFSAISHIIEIEDI